jgi:hypothetical protein
LIIIIILGEVYKSRSSSLYSYLNPPLHSSFFGPNILLNTLFWHTVRRCSSLNIRDHISHPSRTTGKIIVMYILILYSSTEEDRKF